MADQEPNALLGLRNSIVHDAMTTGRCQTKTASKPKEK